MPPTSPRQLAYEILLPFERKPRQRIHIEDRLNRGFEAHAFSPDDRRFTTYLVYGVLRQWFVLNSVTASLSQVPFDKIDPRVRTLLRMGLYQLYGMDSVPDYAAVSSTLNLAEALHLPKKTRGFLNALLQRFIRENKPVPQDPSAALPDWWQKRLQATTSADNLSRITDTLKSIPRLTIRVNTLKTPVENYHTHLDQAGIPYEPSPDIPEVLFILTPQGNPQQLPGYSDGWFMVQDESSARVAHILDPTPGEEILELGAAPGTKTTHMAALMQNQGRIVAVDISSKRMQQLEENCSRLGVEIVEPVITEEGQLSLAQESRFDKVLVDAPCSGTGTVRKHPEILLTLQEKDFARYPDVQIRLVRQGFSHLKPGGSMVYSTCSIDPSENQEVITRFLTEEANARKADERLILPSERHDGFYMVRLENIQTH